ATESIRAAGRSREGGQRMRKVALIAWRDFVATVSSKAFIIGVLVLPAAIVLGVLFGPHLFNFFNFEVKGEVAVIDPTGRVVSELRQVFDPQKIAARRAEAASKELSQAPEAVQRAAEKTVIPIPDIKIIERPGDADIQKEKEWLTADKQEPKRLAIAVIHPDAVSPAAGQSTYGGYDLYIPPGLDERAD